MALSRRGKRKIVVDGAEYLWWVSYDHGLWIGGGGARTLHVCSPDRRFMVALQLRPVGRCALRVVGTHGFTRGPVERGALLVCDATPRDVSVLPGDARRLVDWCREPGPLIPFVPIAASLPDAALTDSPVCGLDEALRPALRQLASRGLVWAAAVCDEEEQPVARSPLILHSAPHTLALWARDGQLAASSWPHGVSGVAGALIEGLEPGAAWLMNPAPLAPLCGQYVSVASLYTAGGAGRALGLMSGGALVSRHIIAQGDRLHIARLLEGAGDGLTYESM